MEKIVIVGGKKLKGSIRVGGAKNAALPILAATLLTEGQCIIKDVPLLRDITVMKEVIDYLGAQMKCRGHTVTVNGTLAQTQEISEELMRKMRASNLIMGPLLGRFGKVRVPYPGGCPIGSRPMDLHLKGFEALGAKITEKAGYITAEAAELTGGEIHLDFPSVGATENIMMAAVLAKGTTYIRNSAKEPEIVDLQNFLNSMGAQIFGAGGDTIKIYGVDKLSSTTYTIIPDRIEAGTHMIAAALTEGDITLTNVVPAHLEPVIAKLREIGVQITEIDDKIRVRGAKKIKPADVKTMPYPGFPTDMQAQMMVLLSVANGTSIITETIFENRFQHVDELRRMGANIKTDGRVAVIKGVPKLTGAVVEASDLRAGAALVLAGLAAEDMTVIENIEHIDRGYESLVKKYASLGARITR